MPVFTGTNGNDVLTGTGGADTFNPLLGKDSVDGLGDSDTLVVDYSSAQVDPYAGASIANVPSVITSSGGSFSGAVKCVDNSNYVTFSSIEHLQVKLDFFHNTFIIDLSALTLGATAILDGGLGIDTLDANLAALASVSLQYGVGTTTNDFATILNFEAFKLNLTEGADNVTTGEYGDTLTGNGGDDVLNSGGGNDILSGGSGTNSLNAGDGDDRIASIGIDTVDGGNGYDRWSGDYGSSSANMVFSFNANTVTASLSNGTTLTGVEGVESLTTGSGNDQFTLVDAGGTLIAAGAGEDSLNATGNGFSSLISGDGAGAIKGSLGYDRFTGIEHLTFVSRDFADVISVEASALSSGATFSLDAAGGTDTLVMDLTAFGSIGFAVGPGNGVTVNVPGTYLNFEAFQLTTGAQVDTIATGNGDDIIRTNGGNDVISTAGGNDLIYGGAGVDSMTGGTGNDTYFVEEAGDSVVEAANEGFDTVTTSVSYVLADGVSVEWLNTGDLFGTAPIALGGNGFGQTIIGNAGANVLNGGGGIDALSGFSGDDYLDGGTGADSMAGGAGNDIYIVDDAGDQALEYGNDGADIVYASASWALGSFSFVEIISAIDANATTALTLSGNELGQSIFGNAGDNFLIAGGGADGLYGGLGNDTYSVDTFDIVVDSGGFDTIYSSTNFQLNAGAEIEILSASDFDDVLPLNLAGNEFGQQIFGNAGRNFLIAGGGADGLYGGLGNDTYSVDTLDIVVDTGGYDTIYSSTNYQLNAGAEIEVLSASDYGATTPLNLAGNDYGQSIFGNAGDNFLIAGGGADGLYGKVGNDTYSIDSQDVVIEKAGEGYDTVYTSTSFILTLGNEVEVISVNDYAATSAINLTGNAFGQQIFGNAGANVLDGGAGADALIGGGGADMFAFTTALGVGNVDSVADFAGGSDKIGLDDAIFTGLGLGALAAGAFVTGTVAGDADDRIIYNAATGQLFFDADGTGASEAILFATLTGHPAIAAGDFMVI